MPPIICELWKWTVQWAQIGQMWVEPKVERVLELELGGLKDLLDWTARKRGWGRCPRCLQPVLPGHMLTPVLLLDSHLVPGAAIYSVHPAHTDMDTLSWIHKPMVRV